MSFGALTEVNSEDQCLLIRGTMYSGKKLPTLRRNLLPPSSGYKPHFPEESSYSPTSEPFFCPDDGSSRFL
jgi:hypothetical protein